MADDCKTWVCSTSLKDKKVMQGSQFSKLRTSATGQTLLIQSSTLTVLGLWYVDDNFNGTLPFNGAQPSL